LAREQPADPDTRSELAAVQEELGVLFVAAGRPAEAEALGRAALATLERLVADFPDQPTYRSSLARAQTNLARIAVTRQDLPPALRLLEQAREHHQAALKAEPDNPAFRSNYRTTLQNLVSVLTRMGRADEAAAVKKELDRLPGGSPRAP